MKAVEGLMGENAPPDVYSSLDILTICLRRLFYAADLVGDPRRQEQ